MKAIQLNQFTTNLDELAVIDTDIPTPGKGQVLVKMLFSAINPSDLNYIRGDYQSALNRLIWNRDNDLAMPFFQPGNQHPHPQLPYTPGGEGVGIVVANGGGLLARQLQGKRVAISAGPPMGTWQEYTVVDAKKAVAVPTAISDEQAAMLLINPLSSYGMLTDVLKVKKGRWLLQSGGASALGKMIIKMCLQFGVNTISIVRRDDQIAELREIGANEVISLQGCEDNNLYSHVQQQVHQITAGKGVDYGLDCIGGAMLEAMLPCLTLNGKMLVYGTLAKADAQVFSRDLMMPCASIHGFFAGNWLAQKTLLQKIYLLRGMKKMALAGCFETTIDSIYAIDEIHQALQSSIKSGKAGKVLIKFS
ncbi:zinc-dependent alcohol dehydrogenase family protein [Thalassotalea sp. PS06]|uniref:zinc-dependent alcohol dehydrogenase family protein n=1 Tax=Thalassotalea sp. PS06 TaxID=2594005 RepID=UPI001162D8DF|nr:zinc-dependent alcohol dehydrogenase family protein [Thalassotalea sp. PS06]QDP02623.1 zinc-dependent alcohol dehydrogenase family protein [Thalassotalea sp. PS06]